jgi:hypothetical protein
MDMYKFHKNEKQVKDVLTRELYDNDLIIESLRSNFLICADFNSLDIQNDLFKMMGLSQDTLNQLWKEYDKKYGNGQDEFKSFEEFVEAVRYVDLATQKAIYQGFAQNVAVAIRNKRYTQENLLKLKCMKEEQYLKEMNTNGDDTAFEEFCACLDIDYDNMTEDQIEIVGKFFDNTMLYAEKLVKQEQIEFLKRYTPFISKLENKLQDRLCVKCEDLMSLIRQSNPEAKPYIVNDDMTGKKYYIVDMSAAAKFDDAKELLELAKQPNTPVMMIGATDDKINIISGKTVVNGDKNSYAIDINLMGGEYYEFYCTFLNYFLRDIDFKDYKGFVNDMLEWGPLFVGFSDFNKYVNMELMDNMAKDKIATKIGVLLKNPRRLENYLKNLAKSYRKDIDKIYQKTIVETKKYSGIVSKYKPEEIIPFAEF